MIYCSKCGKENVDDAAFCIDCGASLTHEVRSEVKRKHVYKENRRKNECFGLPQGGTIFGLVIGIIIIIVGLQQVYGWNIDVGPFAIIIFGLLIAAGAIYGLTRRRT